jgi:hypothetical protein
MNGLGLSTFIRQMYSATAIPTANRKFCPIVHRDNSNFVLNEDHDHKTFGF